MRYHFYPRSPCGERRLISDEVNANNVISIHALLAESDARPWPGAADAWISIHALLAESDGFYADMMALTAISIHALLAESDLAVLHVRGHHLRFLSTLSLRRATSPWPSTSRMLAISIHALLAESDSSACCGVRRKYISIHALLAESDSKTPCVRLSIEVFLSTLSLRRATVLVWCSSGGVSDFYPRSPCGERHSGYDGLIKVTVFLSTLSLRRATPAI